MSRNSQHQVYQTTEGKMGQQLEVNDYDKFMRGEIVMNKEMRHSTQKEKRRTDKTKGLSDGQDNAIVRKRLLHSKTPIIQRTQLVT